MDERRLELKLGVLVLAGVAGLAALLWLMGELSFGRTGALAVDFSHTGNVAPGAPVKLGGVQVGEVDDIRLLADRRDAAGRPLPVQMGLAVDPAALAALRADATVTVATVGLLGEPYLELNPGSAAAAPLAAGATLRGMDAPRLDVVAQQASAFLEAASGILEREPEAFQRLVGNVARLSATLEAVLAENRGDLRTATAELAALVREVRGQLQPGARGTRFLDDAAASAALVRQELPGLTRSAGRTLGALAALTGPLTAEDGERLRGALQRYAEAGAHLEQVMVRADRLLARLEAGEGTLGALQKDPQLYDELRSLVTELRKHPWRILWKD